MVNVCEVDKINLVKPILFSFRSDGKTPGEGSELAVLIEARMTDYLKRKSDGKVVEGGFATLAVGEAPESVVSTALSAARLIGDGLYGVDLKQLEDRWLVIEVNDNPNLEAGVEDAVIKDELYRTILQEFIRRIEAR